MESLTKENFWNELHDKYTAEVEDFCKWIDQYKARIFWPLLFEYKEMKYHNLPIAMQIGIFLQYVSENGSRHGIEIPIITHQDDFERIPYVIKDFFRSKHNDVLMDNEVGKFPRLVPEDDVEEQDYE